MARNPAFEEALRRRQHEGAGGGRNRQQFNRQMGFFHRPQRQQGAVHPFSGSSGGTPLFGMPDSSALMQGLGGASEPSFSDYGVDDFDDDGGYAAQPLEMPTGFGQFSDT